MKVIGHLLLCVLFSIVALVAGLAALLAAAAATSAPALFVSAGGAAYIAAYAAIVLPVYGRRRRRALRSRLAVPAGAVLLAAWAVLFLKPMPAADPGPDPVDGVKRWELSTGSSIAYVEIPAKGERQPYPVVFVHGGPGTPDMAGDSRYFGQLADDGYDVYVYDELGAGRSSRLADPTGYSRERDVEDLEAIRQTIGADSIILIGHSYGGTVVANYMALHGAHVAKAVLSSPGALDPADRSGGDLTLRLSVSQKLKLYEELLAPRTLLAYALLQVDPRAAHAMAGDAEMDARFSSVYNRTETALHADGKPYRFLPQPLGFYANQMPQSRPAPTVADIRDKLSAVDAPALVLKGSDDYLSWAAATDYTHSLKNASLLYLEQAGHNGYEDRPGLVLEAIRSFLADKPLPVEPYKGSGPPPDFAGSADGGR